jgi:hypothetical protein
MDPLAVLCLYSQYSLNCDRFITKIKKNDIDFIQMIPLDTLFSRQLVGSKIKSVPAIIIQYPNSLEIYEGMEAFDWLDEIIQNKNKEEVKSSIQMEMLELQRQKDLFELEKHKLQKTESPPDDSLSKNESAALIDSNSTEKVNAKGALGSKSSEINRVDFKIPSPGKDKYTPIDDVVDDSSSEEQSVEPGDTRGRAPTEPGDTPENSTGTNKKLSASSKKTQDLLSRAKELEKGREDLGNKKPPFPVQ